MKRVTKKTKGTKKSKKTKSVKNKSLKIKSRENSVLGKGKDGCIIDSISCDKFTKENGYVSKFLYNDMPINIEIHKILEEIDHNNERFNRYYLPNIDSCIERANFKDDFETCSKYGKIAVSNMIFQKKLDHIDTSKLTKSQYRYLRRSIEILHENNISHGDLPNNVMLNPDNNMPIIIDWENAKLNPDTVDKQIDNMAFLLHFKVSSNTPMINQL